MTIFFWLLDLFPKARRIRLIMLFVFVLGAIYLLLPGPSSIDDFPGLPNSVKSDLPGDTIQNPNIAAYFADVRRDFITRYYKNIFSRMLFLGLPLPIIALNHPPELAYKYVRDQQESTFLEEYVFLLRESIFVNGYEPSVENQILKKQSSEVGNHVIYNGVMYDAKTTLRFYPSNLSSRLLVYFGIWLSLGLLYRLTKQIWRQV